MSITNTMTDDATVKKGKPKKLPLPVKLVVGAVAGVVGTSCIYPIDMIKTRLQASNGLYSGPIDVVKKIMTAEGGIRGFYKGLVPNLVGVTPEKAIKLAVNEYLRDKLENDDGSIALHHEILAGGGAGLCQVIATNPMEITKIRMQMQALNLPPAEHKSAVQIVRGMGIKGLYSGTMATLARDVPFSVLFFPGYANLKTMLADENGNNSIVSQLLAGGGAGAFASGAVTPSDVIKTRLQVEGGRARYINMGNCLKTIVKEEGFFALYKGVLPRMVVVGPLFAITLLAFETQKDYMIRNGLL